MRVRADAQRLVAALAWHFLRISGLAAPQGTQNALNFGTGSFASALAFQSGPTNARSKNRIFGRRKACCAPPHRAQNCQPIERQDVARPLLDAGAFLVVYSVGSNFSGWAALLAALAFIGLWPALFRAALRFRLANTSWRGLRFRFTGDTAGAYACMLPPLALALLPVAVMGAMAPAGRGQPGALPPAASALVGFGMLAFGIGLMFFSGKVLPNPLPAGIAGGIALALAGLVVVIVEALREPPEGSPQSR